MAKKSKSESDLILYFDKLNLSEFKIGGKKYFTSANIKNDPSGVIEKICSIYRKVRPFLAAILVIPFIPKKIKDAIRVFMDLMDKLCPDQK